MAYEKQTFVDGSTVLKAEHLQHIEQGIVDVETTASNAQTAANEAKTSIEYLTASDVGARPNTWLPTIAEIGAAPSGYGLGNYGETVNSPDDARMSGFYRAPAPAEIASSGYMYGVVFSNSANWVTQVWQHNGSFIRRNLSNGVWDAYEWINPPMKPNAEYRTTERWNGKPVYRKLIQYTNDATISGDSETLIPHGISNLDLSIGVRVSGRRRDMPLPFIKSNGSTSIGYLTSTDLCLKVTGSTTWSPNLWTFELCYTKTS